MKTLEVQIAGATGAGKSTVAHEIAGALKWFGIECEIRDDDTVVGGPWDELQAQRLLALADAGLRVVITTVQKPRESP